MIYNPFDINPYFELKSAILSLSLVIMLFITLKNKNIPDIRKCLFNNKFLIVYISFVLISCLLSSNVGMAIYGFELRCEGFVVVLSYAVFLIYANKYLKLNDDILKYICLSSSVISFIGICQLFNVGDNLLNGFHIIKQV